MAFAEGGGIALAFLGMVRAPPLGDVVEESGEMQQLGLREGVEHVGAVRQLRAVIGAPESARVGDGAKQVLVHRVGMKEVELHEADDPPELRQVASEDPVCVHAPEGPRESARLAQDLEKETAAGEVPAKLVVHHGQVPADLPNRRRPHAADIGVLLDQQEDLEQRRRMTPEHAGVHGFDLTVANLEPPVEPADGRAPRPIEKALAEELEQQLVQPAQGLDGPVVALHELLDAEVVIGVEVAEMSGDRDLPVEEQAVLAPTGQVVERGAGLPEEVLAVAQAPEFLLGQEPVIEEIAQPGHCSLVRAEVASGHPGDGLDVAQASRPLLHVRLEVVGRVAMAQVPLALLVLLGAKELSGRPHAAGRHRVPHLVEQSPGPAEVTGLDEVGDDGQIAARLRRALPDAANRVADLQSEVPGGGDERFDAGVRAPAPERGGLALCDQQQQIDIRAGVELAPAVPPHRDEGRVTAQPDVIPDAAKRVVHRRGARRDELPGRRSLLEPDPNRRALSFEGVAQRRVHRSMASRRAPRAIGVPRRWGERRAGVQGRSLSSRVRISQPSGVTRIVCSHWAESLRSLVTAVQPSGRIFTCRFPALTMGSMVNVIPASMRTPVPGTP